MNDVDKIIMESIILELAEYLKGNRGDSFKFLESFFHRDSGNRYCCMDSLMIHIAMQGHKLATEKLWLDIRKKRLFNFGGQ